jgi:hypothetical protein
MTADSERAYRDADPGLSGCARGTARAHVRRTPSQRLSGTPESSCRQKMPRTSQRSRHCPIRLTAIA